MNFPRNLFQSIFHSTVELFECNKVCDIYDGNNFWLKLKLNKVIASRNKWYFTLKINSNLAQNSMAWKIAIYINRYIPVSTFILIVLYNCNWYYLTVPSLKVLNSILPTQLAENKFQNLVKGKIKIAQIKLWMMKTFPLRM